MQLKRLEICNFRGFYGTQEILFASGKKGLTLIHGENGAGKTNLLNAIFWCLTGEFTPRLSNPEMLLNKASRDEDKSAACFVALEFVHEEKSYRVQRDVTGRNAHTVALLAMEKSGAKPVPHPERVLGRIIPKGISRWFFFDAEAIGELELSGSEEFRLSLRKVLGFELVDGLIADLDLCLRKRQRNLATVVNSEELSAIQRDIDNLSQVIPGQIERSTALEAEVKRADDDVSRIDGLLRNLPKSKPLYEQRAKLDQRRKSRVANKRELQLAEAAFLGEVAPAVLAFTRAVAFEGQLHVKENTGKLPAPYSDQLVEDILHSQICVCGRPVEPDTAEAEKVHGLLHNAATGTFNARVRSVQYLLKDIQGARDRYEDSTARFRSQLLEVDSEVAGIDEELVEIKQELEKIDEDSIRSLEAERVKAQSKYRELERQHAILVNRVQENERELENLQLRYDNAAKKLGHGSTVKKDIEKIQRLTKYIDATLKEQERRALILLGIELNKILDLYLTKHYRAQISSRSYEVALLDEKGREVGRSTGEGQVLKFAFITAVVALAGRKTQEKIDFLAEPTVAPLVLDAPFSALDPEYQSAVARNIADQATQLVLLISSAAWSEGVSRALEPHVGRRYVLISRQSGPRGKKPIKEMLINGKTVTLNEYGSDRDDAVIRELR